MCGQSSDGGGVGAYYILLKHKFETPFPLTTYLYLMVNYVLNRKKINLCHCR